MNSISDFGRRNVSEDKGEVLKLKITEMRNIHV